MGEKKEKEKYVLVCWNHRRENHSTRVKVYRIVLEQSSVFSILFFRPLQKLY